MKAHHTYIDKVSDWRYVVHKITNSRVQFTGLYHINTHILVSGKLLMYTTEMHDMMGVQLDTMDQMLLTCGKYDLTIEHPHLVTQVLYHRNQGAIHLH